MELVNQRYPKSGDVVNVIQKQHYTTGELTMGTVRDVLTKKQFHSRGHKVRLTNGIIGRVQSFVDQAGVQNQLPCLESTPSDSTTVYLPPEDELV